MKILLILNLQMQILQINMSTLFDNIAKEILVDTYLSARINVAEIKKLLLDTYQLEEINNIYSMDYVPVIYLAFINTPRNPRDCNAPRSMTRTA